MSDGEVSSQNATVGWQAPLLGAATLSTLGILEWLVRRPETPLEAGSLALASVVVVHASVGGVAGLAARLFGGARSSLSGIVATALVAFVPAAIYLGGNGLRGAAIGILAAIALLPLIRRGASLLPLTATGIGFAHGITLSVAVALVASQSVEGRTATAPLVVAGLALFGAIRWRALWPNIAGFGALAILLVGGLPPDFEPAPHKTAPSVLLLTLDTLRADRLGFDGFEPAQTPVLDGLAAEGLWFANAQSLSSWTGPSHLTILTGRSPAGHGVLLNARKLPGSIPTLGHVLSEQGWHTGAFVAGFPLQARSIGLRDAFHRYDDRFEEPGIGAFGSTLTYGYRGWRHRGKKRKWRRSAADVNAAVLPWLGEARERPFFAWVHYYDPHLPYVQGKIAGTEPGWDYGLSLEEKRRIVTSPVRMARVSAHYDEQVAYTDRHVGEVVELAREASGGNLWIFVTADHGESFGEHDLFFNRDVYEVTGRVPLIVVPPKGSPLKPGRRDAVVGLHDVAPTLLGALGLSIPPGTEGIDLFAGAGDPGRVIVKRHEPERAAKYQRAISVRGDGFRLIQREAGWMGRVLAPGGLELYDLEADPGETRNLAGTGHPQEAALAAKLPGTPQAEADDATLDDETRDALKALGYLD